MPPRLRQKKSNIRMICILIVFFPLFLSVVNSSADRPQVQILLKHGYIIASADVRGSDASFGSWNGIFTEEETQDAELGASSRR